MKHHESRKQLKVSDGVRLQMCTFSLSYTRRLKHWAIIFFLYLKLSCQAFIKIDIAKHLLNVFIFEYSTDGALPHMH